MLRDGQERGRPPRQEGVQIVAAGFTPNSRVTLTLDGQPYPGGEALQVGPSGALPMAPVPAPFVKAGSREFTITLTEQGNPANTASVTARSAALDVTVTPRSARPDSQVRFDGLGFTEDKSVYLHYVRKGKLRKTVRVARRPGACGGFSKRRRQLPVRKPRLGRWVLQFDQSRRLVDPRAATFVYVRLGIRLRLVPR